MGAEKKQAAERRRAGRKLAATERHVVMCADTGEEGCADAKRMRRAWKHLGRRLEERGLDRKGRVLRSRSRCFGVCAAGPILAVYPDGVWYGGCDPEVLDRIVDEHLIGGKIAEEHAIHRMPPKRKP